MMLWDKDVENIAPAALILTGLKIEAVKSPSHGQQSHSCICERSSHACCLSLVLISLGSLREGLRWDLGRGKLTLGFEVVFLCCEGCIKINDIVTEFNGNGNWWEK